MAVSVKLHIYLITSLHQFELAMLKNCLFPKYSAFSRDHNDIYGRGFSTEVQPTL